VLATDLEPADQALNLGADFVLVHVLVVVAARAV
jgi:hypothetical protein